MTLIHLDNAATQSTPREKTDIVTQDCTTNRNSENGHEIQFTLSGIKASQEKNGRSRGNPTGDKNAFEEDAG
ncbi:MAG: hypothetical protein A2W01_09390 [Candidatus Solincola sediminis]|nr:MAG: hypothetical protein A2W01_09390 [Candidatus Solincola sediminis]